MLLCYLKNKQIPQENFRMEWPDNIDRLPHMVGATDTFFFAAVTIVSGIGTMVFAGQTIFLTREAVFPVPGRIL
jgi:hypothetical protein